MPMGYFKLYFYPQGSVTRKVFNFLNGKKTIDLNFKKSFDLKK